MARLRSVSFRCRGHPDIRASHHKSLEFTKDTAITGRATCVLGVAADFAPDALTGFRGPLTVTIEAGAHSGIIHAVADPAFEPGPSLIVRTSRHHSAHTLAVAADSGADGLDSRLTDELAHPDTMVSVTVAEQPADGRPGRGQLTVLALPTLHSAYLTPDGIDGLATSDGVLADDPAAVRGLLAGTDIGAPICLHADVDAPARLAAGDHLAYVTPCDSTVPRGGPDRGGLEALSHAATEANSAVRVLPVATLALTARVAGGLDAPMWLLLSSDAPADSRTTMLRTAAETGACPAWRESESTIDAALDDIEGALGERPVRLCVSLTSRQGLVLRGTAAQVRHQWVSMGRPSGDLTVVVAAKQGSDEASAGGADAGELARFVTGLLDGGVSARTIAHALAALPGRSYRSEYRRVLRLKSAGAEGVDGG